MTEQQLKGLQTQRSKLIDEIEKEKNIQKVSSQNINSNMERIKRIEQEIERLSNSEIIATEHAMLRYCERVLGINMDEVKKIILNDELKNRVKTLGNGVYPIQGNIRAKVRNNQVITILS